MFFTVVNDSFPNFSLILSAIIDLTLKLICETLLLYTNHLVVHKFKLIILFGIHCSYGLNLNPKLDNVVDITVNSPLFFRLILGFELIVLFSLFICSDFFVLQIHFKHNVYRFTL